MEDTGTKRTVDHNVFIFYRKLVLQTKWEERWPCVGSLEKVGPESRVRNIR